MELHSLTISELRKKLQSKEVSPREVVQALADRIEKVDPQIKGYLTYDLELALKEADKVDVSAPLGGVPIAIKDAINAEGQSCTSASKILKGYRAPYDATSVAQLRTAGAIPFGRTNMDEFAMGSSTENSGYAITHNPWDLTRVPGGSSGGSTAVVAAEEAFGALGSDTGGSIRQPAALCGVVGLKPTYGRVSRYGLTAFASSLDQIGPITKTVEDAAILLEAISGKDPHDSTSLEEPVPHYAGELKTALESGFIKGFKIGLPKEYFISGINPQVEAAVRAAIDHYAKMGAEIVEISMPHTEYAVAVYYLIATAEASANLARFDGVRYGFRAENTQNLLEHYGHTRAQGFGDEVKRRIILGTYVLSSGYYDAYYLRAQKVRTLIRQDFSKAFEKVDALICPTSPVPAFKLGECANDPIAMYLMDIFTIATNLAGVCGISIPCGFTQSAEKTPALPIGLQLICPAFQEGRLLQLAHLYEQTTPWHREKSPLFKS